MTIEELEKKIDDCDYKLWYINMADRFTDADRNAYDEVSHERQKLLRQWFNLTGEKKYQPLSTN